MTPGPDSTSSTAVRRTVGAACVAALAGCGGGGGAGPAQPPSELAEPPWTFDEIVAAAPDQVRLMPLGDSIVAGFGSVGGWRLPLLLGLEAAGIESIRQVGQKTNNWPTDLTPEGHEGHGGWSLQDLIAFSDGGLSASSTIESMLDASQPTLIFLHAGTNDAFEPATWQLATERLEELLDRIEAWDVDTTVVVALIIPTGVPSTNLCIDWINERAAELVAARSQAGSNVQLVDMRVACPEFVSGDGTNVHPNTPCYIEMASAWLESLETLGTVVPTPDAPDALVPGLFAFASSVDGGYLPDFVVSGVGLSEGLHAAEEDAELSWRSLPFDQAAGVEGQAVPVAAGPTFELSLPDASDVTALELWNGRVVVNGSALQVRDAIRTVEVETSPDGIVWTPRGALELTSPPARLWTPPERFDVDWPDTARVRLTVTSTHADVSGGPVTAPVALSELRVRAR